MPREFTVDEILDAGHSVFTSELMSLAEENKFFSQIWPMGSQGEDYVDVQPPQIILAVVIPWMAGIESLWGVRIVEVFEAIEVEDDKYAIALFTLLMNCQGHGISLRDNYEMSKAYDRFGDKMKSHDAAPTFYDDNMFDDECEAYARLKGFGGMIDAERERLESL